MIFGAASYEIELRRVALELRIDGDALVERWRRRAEKSIDAGKTQKWAHQEAYDHVCHEARRRRADADKLRRKR